MKQVRFGKDVKKIDQRDKGGRGEDTSQGVSSTPREGTKDWEENDHPSFSSSILNGHTVKKHYILFVSISLEEQQTNRGHSLKYITFCSSG